MTLRLHNTLSRRKDDLESLPGFDRNNVRMYVCGPTVYDFAHIGNARPVIVFDVLFRLLRHLYGPEHVTYVRNVTDVDDKINARAAKVAEEKGVSVEAARAEITAGTSKQFDEDVAALGCLVPTHTPRATEYIKQMTAMIERLIASGHAYEAEGHVLFDVASKPDYGKLARRSLDEMMAGARVEVAPYKKNPMDFVLWKPSDETTPGWESPWGRGRPGWHIECSAMGEALLGETFDIHGGGVDLTFPHHENEIAQSECAHGGHALARVWMHNGFLQVEGEKMAKSLGNFVTIRKLVEEYPQASLRLCMLETHYRQPINWTTSRVEEDWMHVRSWANAFLQDKELCDELRRERSEGKLPLPHATVIEALSDDLNTPQAVAALHLLYNRGASERKALFESCEFLGLFGIHNFAAYTAGGIDPRLDSTMVKNIFQAFELRKVAWINGLHVRLSQIDENLQASGLTVKTLADGHSFIELIGDISSGGIQAAIDARNTARKAKNFKEADRIRDELLSKGIVLKDGPTGTTWEVKR